VRLFIIIIIIVGVGHVTDFNLDYMTVNPSLFKIQKSLATVRAIFNAQQLFTQSKQLNQHIHINKKYQNQSQKLQNQYEIITKSNQDL
jgi:hypothetical protein